jgi:large subunit ribosomal protein L35Ae
MDARIVSYRRGKRTEYTNQYILTIDGVADKAEAVKHVGKKVVWKTPAGNEVVGKITNTHGNGGALLARFDKGLPGQVLGSAVSIEG